MRLNVVLGSLICSLALSGLGGCKSVGSQSDSSKKEGADAATSDKAPADASKPQGPCVDLQSRLCEKAGQESATCTAAGQLLPLFGDEGCKSELAQIEKTFAKMADLRKDCDTLVKRLCAEVLPKTCEMVTGAAGRFPPERCTQMLKDFPQVLAELKTEDAKNKPIEGELLAALGAPGAPSFGPQDAKVTIVEFSDFQCPYCSRAASVATQIREKYPQVRFVFRQFPLSFHKEAQKASQAALAANADGKFWEFHDLLFQNQSALSPDALRGYAKQVGVSDSAIKDALDGEKYAALVQADIELGNKVGVSGTPSMFVNGKRVDNPTDFATVGKLIDELSATN